MRVPISVINNVKKLESIIFINMYVVVTLRAEPGTCNLQVFIVHEQQDFEYFINAKPQLPLQWYSISDDGSFQSIRL